jgi:glycosyltransferase involved in cell wall biosynthesis
MIEGLDILYFSADDWGCGLTTSQTHIAKTLARKNRILYVNSLGLRKPQVSSKDIGRIFTKLSKFFKGIEPVQENIWVFTPIVLPFHDLKPIQMINKYLLVFYIRFYLRRLKMQRPVFWSFLPNAVHLLGKFKERQRIYYCVDEYSQFEGVPKEAILKQEQQMLQQSDFVFTTATALYQSKRKHNPATYYIPHGVDVAHFGQAREESLPIPADLAALPRPIIGFYGLIESWIDLELLTFLARNKPDWSLVLIGDSNVDPGELARLKNVHFLGRRRYDELPACNKAFDVAIIPFVLNELTRNVNPIKLREYLAAGSPVVATRLPEIEQYHSIVYLADSHPEFLEKIERALTEHGPVPLAQRLAVVEKESWQSRLEQISEIIQPGGSTAVTSRANSINESPASAAKFHPTSR